MSQTNASSFFAEGPTERGFETGDPNKIKIGVLATGNEKGVWARGPQIRRGDGPTYIGVQAETFDDGGSGVYGVTYGDGDGGAGVYGITKGADSVGVKGENQYGGKPSDSGEHVGAGVLGRGYYGVYGQASVNGGKQPRGSRGSFGNVGGSLGAVGVRGEAKLNDSRVLPGIGVLGESDWGLGVVGQSIERHGVVGSSKNGYGGSFESPFAQVFLHPAPSVGAPKAGNHNAGELFCDAHGNLFFCVETGEPGTWKKVKLESSSWFADLVDFLGIGAILGIKKSTKDSP